MFVGFQPAVSPEALGRMSQQVRRGGSTREPDTTWASSPR
ncbi:hypothetical protein FRAHR75_570012 [Frankia sp. Hr75.2]|nr:hypothetical protein FRAHR75_570012 [Frankia sp. Hr75.2]